MLRIPKGLMNDIFLSNLMPGTIFVGNAPVSVEFQDVCLYRCAALGIVGARRNRRLRAFRAKRRNETPQSPTHAVGVGCAHILKITAPLE
jgi:hypothetical protein